MKVRITAALLLLFCFFNGTAQLQQLLYEGPPVFHGAKVIGNRPGTDFLFTVPATGERPITFFSAGLPKGLNLEATSGIIRGKVNEAGEYKVKIIAGNSKGKTEQEITIVIGDKLCLTPPLGWNSWNVFTNTLDEKMVMDMADAMVHSGMRDLGYQYINMDDYWHDSTRAPDGKPVPNPEKFPHGIKWLADYVHSKGLKLGIYSDAGSKTCGKCFGSYGYEEMDANTYAEWGVDLLKYDFCFVPWKKMEAIARYKKMGDALKSSNRSIVYSICNWGLFKPWEWGPEAGGNYWRTTPDIFDIWRGGIPFVMSTMRILKKQNKILAYGKPGHWNDPDMLIVGNYGQGKATSWKGKFKGMTDVQYQSHMSLWAMMNAPLLSSCDLRNMNEATKKILMNPELLSINQDAKGESATLVLKKNGIWLYKKNLKDGSVAVAVFNTSKKEKQFELTLEQLGLTGTHIAHDVWQHTEAGILKDKMPLTVKGNETVVLRIKQSN
ncbi:MAG: putative Ig domain-containing protein [Chitinophagales bacterium]|nr:putative Ig domain-containing protein [Chitinophagales bacterium]